MIFIVFLPFVMAILMRHFCKKQKKIVSETVLFTTLIECIGAIVVTINFRIGNNITLLNMPSICGVGLSIEYNNFRAVFGMITAFAWFISYLASREILKRDKNQVRYYFYYLITLGATEGIFFSSDFFTLFFFFEIMSLASFMWVAHKETKEAKYAAGTYLGISVAGGLAILMGVFIIYDMFGTVSYKELAGLSEKCSDMKMLYVAAGCMFAGFGAKASAFPVHVWLPNAYTQAPAPESALLSAILSKTGILGILMISSCILPANENWGMFIVVTGIVTMVVGGVRAVLNTNLKTTIAYSSMSQIGFILVGVGMQTLCMNGEQEIYEMAVNGTVLHMINHSIAKMILFISAGVIFTNVGAYELDKVRGFGHNKPFIKVTFLLAAAGLSGIPLLNGYVSKTLLHESIVEYTHIIENASTFKTIEYLFLFSGGLTLCYMLKLFMVVFVEKNEDPELQKKYDSMKTYISEPTKYAIGICSLLIPVLGIVPQLTSEKIAGFMCESESQVNYFTMTNLLGAIVSISIGLLVYFVVVRLCMYSKKRCEYVDIWPRWIDLEKYVYRAVLYRALSFLLGIVSRILDSIVDTLVVVLRKTIFRDLPLPYELPEGNRATHILGSFLEWVNRMQCAFSKEECVKKNYEHKLALRRTDIIENTKIIERSLSFGLFMFCLGLTLTLCYLLIVN